MNGLSTSIGLNRVKHSVFENRNYSPSHSLYIPFWQQALLNKRISTGISTSLWKQRLKPQVKL